MDSFIEINASLLLLIHAVRLKLVVTRFKKLEEKNRLLLFITHLRRQVLEVVHTTIQRKIKMLYDRTTIVYLIAECAKTRVCPLLYSRGLEIQLVLQEQRQARWYSAGAHFQSCCRTRGKTRI